MNIKKLLSAGSEKIIILFLTLSVLPFLILSMYVNPCWDDFDYAEIFIRNGFSASQDLWYTIWSGRYFSTAFLSVFNPLSYGSFAGYKFLILIFIPVFILAVYYLTTVIAKNKLTWSRKIIISLTFTVLYFTGMPSPKLNLFWLSSVVIYQFANILVVLIIALLIKLFSLEKDEGGIKISLFICLLIAAVCGSNEVSMVMLTIFFIFLFLFNMMIKKKADMKLLIFVIVSIVSSVFVYIAPGNIYRTGLYGNNHQLLYSLQNSAIELTGFITYKNITLPFIIVNVIFILMCVKVVSGNNNFSEYLSVNPLYPVLIFLTVLYSGFFASYWSLGVTPFPRIMNVIYFFFLLGWFFNLFLIIDYAYKRYTFTLNFKSAVPYLILYSLLFFSVIFLQGSVMSAYKDLIRGTAAKFDTELRQRYEYIYNDKSDTCRVAEIKNVPPSLFFHDITGEPDGQYNIIQAKYFNKKYLIIKGD